MFSTPNRHYLTQYEQHLVHKWERKGILFSNVVILQNIFFLLRRSFCEYLEYLILRFLFFNNVVVKLKLHTQISQTKNNNKNATLLLQGTKLPHPNLRSQTVRFSHVWVWFCQEWLKPGSAWVGVNKYWPHHMLCDEAFYFILLFFFSVVIFHSFQFEVYMFLIDVMHLELLMQLGVSWVLVVLFCSRKKSVFILYIFYFENLIYEWIKQFEN